MIVRTAIIAVVVIACTFTAAVSFSKNVARVDHSLLSAVLKDVVSNGRVDYARLKRDTRLSTYLTAMSKVVTASMSEDERTAYWINVYNAATLHIVSQHFPIRSIRDITIQGYPSVWKAPLVSTHTGMVSLDHIENNVLRPRGDARIHMALVCAAVSCPPLRSEAYTAADLQGQLDDQCRQFVRDRRHNVIDTTARTARVSKIFEWFIADFGGNPAGIVDFLYQHAGIDRPVRPLTVTFADYDWSLNVQ